MVPAVIFKTPPIVWSFPLRLSVPPELIVSPPMLLTGMAFVTPSFKVPALMIVGPV